MTHQLVLVIVVIAAGIALIVAMSFRTTLIAHRGNAPKSGTIVEAPPEGEASSALRVPAAGQPAIGERSPSSAMSVALEAPLEAGSPPDARTSAGSGGDFAPDGGAGRATAAGGSDRASGITPLESVEVFAKLFDLALGKARPRSSVSSGHIEVMRATGAALQDTATQRKFSPRRPNMLPRILNAASDDAFSRRELAALIARDPSLVGNLLKIANSSFYRITPEPVESVDRAVVLLGMDGIRSLVTAALMQPIFRIGGADFPRFPEIAWEHTFRSASAAVPYNFLVERSDPAAAELLSLVMGLAGIVIFRVTMEQYARNARLRPDAGVVSSLLDTHSAEVARRIGAGWELSEATLAGLDGQTVGNTRYATALGRSLHFGRLVGALAVLRINNVIDEDTAKASIPSTSMPEAQVERMWTRLTPKPVKR